MQRPWAQLAEQFSYAWEAARNEAGIDGEEVAYILSKSATPQWTRQIGSCSSLKCLKRPRLGRGVSARSLQSSYRLRGCRCVFIHMCVFCTRSESYRPMQALGVDVAHARCMERLGKGYFAHCASC